MKTSMNSRDIITSFILPVNPTGQYKRFVRICNTEKINCKSLITLNMDKYLNDYLNDNDNYISEDRP